MESLTFSYPFYLVAYFLKVGFTILSVKSQPTFWASMLIDLSLQEIDESMEVRDKEKLIEAVY
jgi:hypothetical protein